MKQFVLENPPRRRRRRSSRTKSRRKRRARPRAVATARVNPPRRRRRRATSRRRVRRNPFRRYSRGAKMNPFNLRNVFSRENLAVGTGAVTSSIASNLIIGRAGRFLPGVMSPFGRAAYNTILPIAVAWVTNRFAPNLAKGMVIGGIANGLGQLATATRILPAGTVVSSSPMPASLPAAPETNAQGEYLGEYLGRSPHYMGEYLGMGYDDAYDVGAAFATDAWA